MTEDTAIVYEEWVTWPDQHRFVPLSDHFAMGSNPGWWALPTRFAEGRVRELGYKPESPRAK